MPVSMKASNVPSRKPSHAEDKHVRNVLSHGLAIATGSIRLALAKQRERELRGAEKKLDELKTGLHSLQQDLRNSDIDWEPVHRVEHHLSVGDLQKRINRLKQEYSVMLDDLQKLHTLDYFTPAAATAHRSLREFMRKCAELERDFISSRAQFARGEPLLRSENLRGVAVYAKEDAEPWDKPGMSMNP